jgi:LacI family kdg operon repressor
LQVARDAGVSKTSVSRYLGGDLDSLSPSFVEAIRRSISKLKYSPNQMARGLKRGRSRLIGMLVADIRDPYSIAVLRGVEAACQSQGYSFMICNAAGGDSLEHRYLTAMRSYSVEGLIIHTIGHNTEALRTLIAGHVPVVLLDRKIPGFETDTVGLDNTASMQVAIGHLLKQGYRDMLFVSGTIADTTPRQERHAAFNRFLSGRAGVRRRTLETGFDDAQSLLTAIKRFLADTGHGPKVIFAFNGLMLLAVTRALRVLKVRLGRDVGLIGIDELDWCSLVDTGITTVAQPTYEIGVSAADCLFRRLGGDSSPPCVLAYPGKLIARGSTDTGSGT